MGVSGGKKKSGEIQKTPLLRGRGMVTVIRNKMSCVSNLRSSCTKRCSLLEGDKKNQKR